VKHWVPALVMVAATAWAAAAASHGANDEATAHEVVMASALGPSSDSLHLSIVQVFFPGLSERVGCRMQVIARNDSHTHISMRALVNTFDDDKAAVDAWLVPTGDLKPGEEVMRIYSCHTAHEAVVSEASPYGWPQVCFIDGKEMSPCPLTLRVVSSLEPPLVSKEGGGKKEGH